MLRKRSDKILFLLLSFIGMMIIIRMIYSGSFRYMFLVWNLFLAWIPYMISKNIFATSGSRNFTHTTLLITWFLFFPNALYIVTDLIHLRQATNIPVWYDAILLFMASITGLVMAFLSLQRIELFLQTYFTMKSMRLIIAAIIFSGAFGVYLGRFGRWNSWDVINQPVGLASDIGYMIFYPHENLHTWGITLLLASLYSMLYFIAKFLHAPSDATN